ncbi:ester cyclase [Microbulbifer salipaludis]|nr:ester cyclase [Microbulbifer salipaludis]
MHTIIMQMYGAAAAAPSSSGAVASAIAPLLTEDVTFCAAHPINDLQGSAQVAEQFFAPLLAAMPDLERKEYIAVPGEFQGKQWVNGTGYLMGTFAGDLFGIPASNAPAYLRYTEMVRFEGERIAEYYVILDFLDLMTQVGVNPLRPGLGFPGLVPPPSDTSLGLVPGTAAEGRASIELIEAMLDCLGGYDGKSLHSMALAEYWTPDFMWYGPAGIGTTRGIDGFRRQHQGPFLRAFPDRVVDRKQNLVGCGNYASTGGWPHMTATHSGEGWLGLAPSGRTIKLRVMDIWRREGGLLRENWVGIDIIHMLKQLGLDVFEQMRQLQERGQRYV